jgi:hypothetical protein
MNRTQITHAEQALWQRRAAAQLAAILAAHPDLPPIAWTVGPAGSTLTGRINGLVPAMSAQAAFEAWRQALPLAGQPTGGARRTAAGACNGVRVILTATVADHHGSNDGDHNGRLVMPR